MRTRSFDAFVSAVTNECGKARDATAAELRKRGLRVAVQSDFEHRPASVTTLQKLHDYIRDCDEVHCIVGTRSGACPPAEAAAPFAHLLPPGITKASYTHWEYFFALHYVPDGLWLYLATDAYQPDLPAPDGPDQLEVQQHFVEHLRHVRGHDYAPFANVGEVRAAVLGHHVQRRVIDTLPATGIVAGLVRRAGLGEAFHRIVAANAIGTVIGGIVMSVLPWLLAKTIAFFSWLATELARIGAWVVGEIARIGAWILSLWRSGTYPIWLIATITALLGVAFLIVHYLYAAILTRQGPHARAAYDRLRHDLAAGGLAAETYARWLAAALNAVDRFFGDAGMAGRTLFPRAFGLRNPAPLWTASAFVRCLLLASMYLVATIFVVWAAFGHVGPAEHALGLTSGLPTWRRACVWMALTVVAMARWRAIRATSSSDIWWCIVVALTAVIIAVVGAGSVAITGVILIPGFFATVYGRIRLHQPSSLFLLLSFQVVILLLPILIFHNAAATPMQEEVWSVVGPVALFVGLLPLLKAPFDWAALGLTRGLLRRGLELGGWFSYLIALVDTVVGACLVSWLSAAIVLGVQAFNTLAAFSGGEHARILPLDTLFDGIAANPAAPEFWWVYAMLLSTMIPSLVNLTIGGASLLRGIPWITTLLLRNMPDRGAPPAFERAWMTLLLTSQLFLGGLLGIAAQVFLAYVVIGIVLPWFGLDLLDLARAVAALDLPGHVLGVFTATPPP